MLGANATIPMPREPPIRPMTIHGRRMPSRDAVRSLIRPKNGLPTMATRAPIPATSAKLLGACLIPTSEFTFNAKVTSTGARNRREVLIYASVYSEMKPQPTCRATGGSGPSAASAAVRSFNLRCAVPGQAAAAANRTTREGMMIPPARRNPHATRRRRHSCPAQSPALSAAAALKGRSPAQRRPTERKCAPRIKIRSAGRRQRARPGEGQGLPYATSAWLRPTRHPRSRAAGRISISFKRN